MSFFVTYSPEDYEYLLTPAGYIALIVLMLIVLSAVFFLSRSTRKQMKTRQLVISALAMALAMVTSYIKFASLPFGGSITLFSMFFICFIGYLYGLKAGLLTGIAYGILQLIIEPYIYSPVQMLMDYPLAFGALGLSGIFTAKKNGLIMGCILGMLGRYLFHVISGYIFFGSYAPEGMNPMVYTLGYNATYILPELAATIVLLCVPAIRKGLAQVKIMANE